PTKAFLRCGTYGSFGLIAIEENHTDWWIISPGEKGKLNPLFDSRVVGIMSNPEDHARPCLVVLEADNRSLALRSTTKHIVIHTAAAPIEEVTVSHAAPFIAYTTREGEVVIYSITHKEAVCRYLPEEKQ